jgi:hypothetical protein
MTGEQKQKERRRPTRAEETYTDGKEGQHCDATIADEQTRLSARSLLLSSLATSLFLHAALLAISPIRICGWGRES